jgi:hypothetical protein
MLEQHAKERACYVAAVRGFALFTRGKLVYSAHPDGTHRLVCGSRSYSDVWSKTLRVLSKCEEFLARSSHTYRLVTPSGMYASATWWGLVWNWLRRCPVPPLVVCDGG